MQSANEEIQAELRIYQALYQEDEQPACLQALRQTAMNAMQLLRDFHPRLTGAVLDGTAGRHSPIRLQLFADSSKDVEIWLLSNNISFKPAVISRKHPAGVEDQLVLNMDDVDILLDIYPLKHQRGLLATQSMALDDVQALLFQPAPPIMTASDCKIP